MGAAGIATGPGGIIGAGIGRGSSEATRTGLARATRASAGGAEGVAATVAGATIGSLIGAAEATRTGRAAAPGATASGGAAGTT